MTKEQLKLEAKKELRKVRCEGDNHYPLDSLSINHIKVLESFCDKMIDKAFEEGKKNGIEDVAIDACVKAKYFN